MKIAAVAMLALSLGLAACEKGPGTDEPASTPSAGGNAGRGSSGDAVAAVLTSPGTPVAKLSFVVDSRPVKGVPFKVGLIASAGAAVSVLEVAASSGTLDVQPETAVLAMQGESATHELTLTSAEEGLHEFTVRLKAEGAAEAVYAIPVLVMAVGATPAGEGG